MSERDQQDSGDWEDQFGNSDESENSGESSDFELEPKDIAETFMPAVSDDEDEVLTEREEDERLLLEGTDWASEGERVFDELMERVGEAAPEPRLHATRRAVELLGDVHTAYPVIHLTGTNGKSSTARIIETVLRAHGLRTGLLTSPHLERLNERIAVDGSPISDERLVANWEDITPFLSIVDAELEAAGEPRLTFFEALTVLAYACFADAPVDVAVVEVGMGGEWDSTNVADGEVAVFTPIALDHTQRLGRTLDEIARTKAGIIKPAARVVTAEQHPEVLAEIERAAEISEAQVFAEPKDFSVVDNQLAVGGRLVTVRGIAGKYEDLLLPLDGEYQAHNAAGALAAVEAFFGANRSLRDELVEAAFGEVKSPGRLERIGVTPPMLIDAAHNPHGADALARAVTESFDFSRVVVVLGVLEDKDAAGIVRALQPIAERFVVTQSDSVRAIDAETLGDIVRDVTGGEPEVLERAEDAIERAREIALDLLAEGADEGKNAAVLITGSVTLIGTALTLSRDEGWAQES